MGSDDNVCTPVIRPKMISAILRKTFPPVIQLSDALRIVLDDMDRSIGHLDEAAGELPRYTASLTAASRVRQAVGVL